MVDWGVDDWDVVVGSIGKVVVVWWVDIILEVFLGFDEFREGFVDRCSVKDVDGCLGLVGKL